MSEPVQTAWVSRPVGGIPISADLLPSIVFAVLYALLLPNIIYNFFFRNPRAAAHPEKRASGGLMKYVQATVGLGFIGISSDTIKLLRCILVHTTLPEHGASKDRRTARRFYRYFCYVFELAFLASTIPGTVASYGYSSARFDQAKADKNLRLLKASASVVLAFQVTTIIVSLWAAFRVKEIDQKRCFELAALTTLVIPVPIYRLCVLGIRTIDVFEPLSPPAHAIFYIVHLVPEWLCVSVLLGTNVRARFRTGRWGDYELRESLRDKRLEKAAEDGTAMGSVDGSKVV